MEFSKHKFVEIAVDKIKELTFNRAKNEKHVQALVKSIARVGILRTPVLAYTTAITGKAEYYNVDGQHLVESLKRLRIKKVHCIVVETDSVSTIVDMMATLNNVQQKWTLTDYVNAYCGLGNENYFRLKEHFIKNGLSVAISASILGGSATSGRGLTSIRNGNFTVNMPDSEVLTKNLIEASSVVKTNSNKFHTAFCSVYRSLGSKYDHNRMINALKSSSDFERIPHDTGYLLNLLHKTYKDY
jgi:uncharacterized ParB-like nuclease family protein